MPHKELQTGQVTVCDQSKNGAILSLRYANNLMGEVERSRQFPSEVVGDTQPGKHEKSLRVGRSASIQEAFRPG